jgi:hypothetical protein
MATQDTTGVGTPRAHFCTECGAQMADGRFCPNCGTEFDAPTERLGDFGRHHITAQRVADSVNAGFAPNGALDGAQAVLDATSGAPPAPPRRRWRIFAVTGLLLCVAAAAAAVLIFVVAPGGSDAGAVYRDKVADAVAPVNRANRDLSTDLARLRGSRPIAARSAAARAQRATTSAQGAVNALTVPKGSERLASRTRQALDREQSYLTAVRTVLADPSNPAVSQLQSLAGNLTSAFDAVGIPLAGAAESVSGDDRLSTWAHRTSHRKSSTADGAAAPTSAPAAAPSPYASGRDCGGGLSAGPNTSCEFARNVQSAYNAAPGLSATVEVFSPVTGETYSMHCAPAGSGTTCSGGNSASVSW